MAEEYTAFLKNHTWSLVLASLPMNIFYCGWVFKVKRQADGTIECHRACLVAKGYNQQDGLDHTETFNTVVKPATICIILAIVFSQNWSLKKLDIRNAFLNGVLQEDVYMHHPPGFSNSFESGYVYKINRALYSMKQAPRA